MVQSRPKNATSSLFIAYLILLVWLPIPYGSNQPWAWALMEVWVYLMTAVWLLKYARGRVDLTEPFRRARHALILFSLWLGYGLFQMTSLPISFVETVSPATAIMYQQAILVSHLDKQDLKPAAQSRPLPAFPDTHNSSSKGTGETDRPKLESSELEEANNKQTLATNVPLEITSPNLSNPPSIRLTLDLSASITAWLKSLAYVLLFSFTLLMIDTRQRLKTLCYVIVLSGLIQAVYGSLSLALEGGSVANGSFVNRNHYAAYLVLCLAVGIGLLIALMGRNESTAVSWRNRVQYVGRLLLSAKAPLRIFLAIMVIALVLTHSRMGNSSFFISLLITGALFLGLSKELPRSVLLLIISLIIVDVAIIGSWVGLDKVRDRILETSLATDGRDEVAMNSLKMWQDYPIFGSGAGSWYSVFPGYRKGDASPGFYEHTHNDYLEFLTEYGAIGVSLLALAVIMALTNALLALRNRQSQLAKGTAFAALMAISAMLIHASVEFNLQIPAYAATLMVILALPWIARNSDLV